MRPRPGSSGGVFTDPSLLIEDVRATLGVATVGVGHAFDPGLARREQDRVVALQANASDTVRPQLWVVFDSTWYSGGTTRVDGIEKADLQRNSRIGATISLPLAARQSLKASVSTGAQRGSAAISTPSPWFGRWSGFADGRSTMTHALPSVGLTHCQRRWYTICLETRHNEPGDRLAARRTTACVVHTSGPRSPGGHPVDTEVRAVSMLSCWQSVED